MRRGPSPPKRTNTNGIQKSEDTEKRREEREGLLSHTESYLGSESDLEADRPMNDTNSNMNNMSSNNQKVYSNRYEIESSSSSSEFDEEDPIDRCERGCQASCCIKSSIDRSDKSVLLDPPSYRLQNRCTAEVYQEYLNLLLPILVTSLVLYLFISSLISLISSSPPSTIITTTTTTTPQPFQIK